MQLGLLAGDGGRRLLEGVAALGLRGGPGQRRCGGAGEAGERGAWSWNGHRIHFTNFQPIWI